MAGEDPHSELPPIGTFQRSMPLIRFSANTFAAPLLPPTMYTVVGSSAGEESTGPPVSNCHQL